MSFYAAAIAAAELVKKRIAQAPAAQGDLAKTLAQMKFIREIAAKNEKTALRMLSSGAGRLEALPGEEAPLFMAIEHGLEDLALAILAKAANSGAAFMEARDSSGEAALWQATRKNMRRLAAALLDGGALMREKNENDCSLLCWALKNNREEIALEMIKRSKKIKIKEEGLAHEGGQARAPRKEGLSCLDDTDRQGMTATMLMFYFGKYELAETLIEAGAQTDVEGQDWKRLAGCESAQKNRALAANFLKKAKSAERRAALFAPIAQARRQEASQPSVSEMGLKGSAAKTLAARKLLAKASGTATPPAKKTKQSRP